ncbi:MAG: DUF4446 family protein [bacterium]|nr:DUF4446 family protein [bacterium]
MLYLMTLDPNILIYAPLAVSIIIVVWLARLEMRINRLLRGKDAKTLEDTILGIDRGLGDARKFQKDMEQYLTSVETRLRRSAQGVGTVRFNAFRGTGEGGSQSFATAFLNEHGDGVVISSMYSRDRVSVFSKPLTKFKSEYELSKEEKEAVAKAKGQLPQEQ